MLSTNQGMNGPKLLEAFQLYQLPLNISQDYTDPVDGHVHRFQNRCLGTCSIKSGSQVYPNVTFYEITESEISDITNSSPVTEEEILESVMVDSKELPPKKRKRRRMIRYEIIFSVDKGPVQLTPEYVFFALPRDAVTECLIESAPHKLLFSFFPQSCGISQNTQCACHSYPPPIVEETLYKTKLEEFAAVCSTSCKLTLPDQSKSEGHVNNILLTGVSHELYRAIKQMVSSYEIMCQNTMELMRLHHEKSLHHKAELAMFPEPDVPLPNQSDEEYQASKSDSSSDEHWDKDLAGNKKLSLSPEILSKKPKNLGQHQQQQQQKGRAGNASNQIKKCLYCGSKSTPMWRRGPQGAGTLCNACGVKWKHGKILNGSEANEVIAPPSPAQRRGSKSDKKRKRPSASISSSSGSSTVNTSNKRANKKRNSVNSTTENIYYDTFAVPAPIMPTAVQQWEGQSASSSTSDSRSPLQSFSSSPNTSPSIATLMDQQDIKRDISSLMTYDTETLSVYVGEDAVEAAAVLTLLKRS